MADVHLIGEIVGAEGIGSSWRSTLRLGGGQCLWCRWEISVSSNGRWEKMDGARDDDGNPACVDAEGEPVLSEYGQTQVCFCRPGGRAEWAHPIDVHYSTTSMNGWPRMLLEVWSQDADGRNELAGYATTHIPAAHGVYELVMPLWRPVAALYKDRWSFSGMAASLRGTFLGVWPRLKGDVNAEGCCKSSVAKSVINNVAKERTPENLTTVGTGMVSVKLTVMTKGFNKLGPGTRPNLEEWLKEKKENDKHHRENKE